MINITVWAKMDLGDEKGKNLERPPAFYLEMVSTYKKGTGSGIHLGWLEGGQRIFSLLHLYFKNDRNEIEILYVLGTILILYIH